MTAMQSLLNPTPNVFLTEAPLRIDLEDLLEGFIRISIRHQAPKGAIVGVDVPIYEHVYSLIGRVVALREAGTLFEHVLQIEEIPIELVHAVEAYVEGAHY